MTYIAFRMFTEITFDYEYWFSYSETLFKPNSEGVLCRFGSKVIGKFSNFSILPPVQSFFTTCFSFSPKLIKSTILAEDSPSHLNPKQKRLVKCYSTDNIKIKSKERAFLEFNNGICPVGHRSQTERHGTIWATN